MKTDEIFKILASPSKSSDWKCLDLEVVSGHLNPEGWLYILIICNFGEEVPFLWQFEREGIGNIYLFILSKTILAVDWSSAV